MRTELDLESIISALYSPLFRYAFALTRNETLAADLTQEAFLILARQRSQVDDVTKITAWLFTTLRRAFLRNLGSQSSHPQAEIPLKRQNQPVTDPAPLQAANADTELKALAQVDHGYRMALVLFYQADLSYKEIAAALDIPIGTAISRLSRGKEQLRSFLVKTAPPNTIGPSSKAENLQFIKDTP